MCTNRACNILSTHMNISVYIKSITRLLQYYVNVAEVSFTFIELFRNVFKEQNVFSEHHRK